MSESGTQLTLKETWRNIRDGYYIASKKFIERGTKRYASTTRKAAKEECTSWERGGGLLQNKVDPQGIKKSFTLDEFFMCL